MRKMFCLVLMLVLINIGLAYAEIPAPFAKAKEMALKTDPNEYGNYIVMFEHQNAKGYQLFLIGYIPKLQTIGIGMLIEGEMFIAEYHEDTGMFSMWCRFWGSMEAEAKDVIKFAFDVFRELVAGTLI